MSDITPFNDLMKQLDTTTSTDEQVSQLAQQLLAQGLASTLLEAKEKAKTMLNTEKKANQGFSERKAQMTKYNDPRSDPDYYKKQNINDLRQRALSSRPIRVQDEFQTPGFERRNGSVGLPRAVIRSTPEPTIEPGESPRPEQFKPENTYKAAPYQSPQPAPQPVQRPAPPPTPQQAQPAPQPVQHPAPQPQPVPQQAQPAPQPQPTAQPAATPAPVKEIPQSEIPEPPHAPEKKKPSVSLHDVFNFGKR